MYGTSSVRLARYDEYQHFVCPLCQFYHAYSQQLRLLDQLASMRAALFHYNSPPDFLAKYLLSRLFKFMPEALYLPVAPTRKFWMHIVKSKIHATIRNEGDMIGSLITRLLGLMLWRQSGLSYAQSHKSCHRRMPTNLSIVSFLNRVTLAFITL